MTHLIGMTGLMGSGKSEVAKMLLDIGGYFIYAMASPLRDEVAEILKTGKIPHSYPDELRVLVSEYMGQPEVVWKKPIPPNMRRILQLHGTEYRREQDADYWVNIAQDEIFMLPKVVIEDVRYENEYWMVKNDGGQIWLMDRQNRPGACNENHISEQFARTLGPHNVDRVIDNNGTLEDLYSAVQEALWCSRVAA